MIIRHPLLRCGLFIILYLAFAFVLLLFGRSFYFIVIMNQVAIAAATAVMLAMDHRGPEFIGLSLRPGWWRHTIGGFALGWAMIGVIALSLYLSGRVRWEARDWQPLFWLGMTGLFLLAAAGEELLFRGYGFQRLVEAFGAILALVVLSALFGAGHFYNPGASWPGIANTVLVGLVFGLAYLRTGQLWLPIGWHWGWNLAEATFGFPVSGIKMAGMPWQAESIGSPLWTGAAYGPEASLPGTAVLLLGLVLVLCLPKVVPHVS